MATRRDSSEVAVRDVAIRFCKQHVGRGPHAARAFLLPDRVLICLRGLLGAAEHVLARADESGTVRELLRELFRRLVEHQRPVLEAMLADVLGRPTHVVHLDLCAVADEAVLVVSLGPVPRLAEEPAQPDARTGEKSS